MKMRDLKIDDYASAIKHIVDSTSTRAGYEKLLAGAAADTPIIGELAEMLSYFESLPGNKKKGDCGAIQRDIVVLLALRHLEKIENAAAN